HRRSPRRRPNVTRFARRRSIEKLSTKPRRARTLRRTGRRPRPSKRLARRAMRSRQNRRRRTRSAGATTVTAPRWPSLKLSVNYQPRGRRRTGRASARPTATPAFATRAFWLLPFDLGDLVGLGAAWRHNLDGLALLLVDERACDRRGDRDAA